MQILHITLNDFNKFLHKDPKLCLLGLSDQCLDYLYHTGSVIIDPETKLFGVYKEDRLICCLELNKWNNLCGIIHCYLATNEQHKGVAQEIYKAMAAYCASNKLYSKLYAFVPEPCINVLKAIKAAGGKQEGFLANSYIWRQEVVGMHVFGIEIENR